jgi:DNA-directed RNA polymerase specialized sigma24 family protein
MWLNYIEKKTKEEIISLIGIHENEYSKVSRQAIKSFKSCVKSHFPDYYDAIFTKKTDGDTIPIDKVNTARITQKPSNVMAKIDVERYLSLMPNDRYRKVLKSYFLDGLKPEEIAKDLDIKVDNVYNLKLRGLDQIRDIIIFSGEIENIERYIKEVSNDRNYEILYSLFVRKMSYESISTSLGLSENAFKKAKRCAINDLRRIIFKS